MITKMTEIELPEGKFNVLADHFEKNDLYTLKDIYKTNTIQHNLYVDLLNTNQGK